MTQAERTRTMKYVQMTWAERTRTIKCILAERSRWLLHRKGHEKDKDTVTQEKNKERKKESRN